MLVIAPARDDGFDGVRAASAVRHYFAGGVKAARIHLFIGILAILPEFVAMAGISRLPTRLPLAGEFWQP